MCRQRQGICSQYTMVARRRTDQCLWCAQSLVRLPSTEIHWQASLSLTKMHSRSYAKSTFKRMTRSFSYACKSSMICFSRKKTSCEGIRAQIATWIWTRAWEKLSWSRVYHLPRLRTIIISNMQQSKLLLSSSSSSRFRLVRTNKSR